jgi:cold shock CspA family protein
MDSDLFKVGTELEFSLEEKPKGPEAYAVEVIDQCE